MGFYFILFAMTVSASALPARAKNYLFKKRLKKYVKPNTCNSLLNSLKSATSINSFRHNIKIYSSRKLGDIKSDIYGDK